jgi:hypothetical protein
LGEAIVADDAFSEDHEAAAIDDSERLRPACCTASEGNPALDLSFASDTTACCFQSE